MVWTGTWVAERLGVELIGDEELPALLGLALRRNPKRAHLLVSGVLGKHVPQRPSVVYGAGLDLGRRVRELLGDEEAARAVVLGYAETATALGHAVADGLALAPYLHSTRRPVAGVARAGGFEESHSHATSHLLLPEDPKLLAGGAPPGPKAPGRPLVLVDDEFSTGNTVLNTIRDLHERHPRERYVVVALVDMRSAADHERLDAFAEEIGARVDLIARAAGTVRLPEGSWRRAGRSWRSTRRHRSRRPPPDLRRRTGRPRLAPGPARRRAARLHAGAPGTPGGGPSGPGGRAGGGPGDPGEPGARRDPGDPRDPGARRPARPRPRLRGADVRAAAPRHRPGGGRTRRPLLHHHPLARPRRRRPRLRDPHPARLPRPRRSGRRPRRALRLQRGGRGLRRRRPRRRLRRRHPGPARPGRPPGPARGARAARGARGGPLVRPRNHRNRRDRAKRREQRSRHPHRHRSHRSSRKELHAARAPPRPRLLLVRTRRGRLAAPGPLGRRTRSPHRGARGGHPERRRPLRGVAARRVPAQRALPGSLPGRPGELRRPGRPRGRHGHRDRPRRARRHPRARLARPRRHPRRRPHAPLGPGPPRPRPAALRRLDRARPGHRRQRCAGSPPTTTPPTSSSSTAGRARAPSPANSPRR